MARPIILIAVVVLALLGFWLWRPAKPAVELPAMVREIRALNELATVKYKVQKVVGLEEAKAYLGSERILLIVQADVVGGVDLNGLQAASLHLVANRRVLVKLPAAKILNVLLDEKQTKVWDRSVTWWTPWVPYNIDLERQARLKAIESIRENALEMGILEHARRNAETSIARLLSSLGMEAVTFGSQYDPRL